ncbi:hypothetical protein Ancab_011311 [Ancistrocladus abbreviatus]
MRQFNVEKRDEGFLFYLGHYLIPWLWLHEGGVWKFVLEFSMEWSTMVLTVSLTAKLMSRVVVCASINILWDAKKWVNTCSIGGILSLAIGHVAWRSTSHRAYARGSTESRAKHWGFQLCFFDLDLGSHQGERRYNFVLSLLRGVSQVGLAAAPLVFIAACNLESV